MLVVACVAVACSGGDKIVSATGSSNSAAVLTSSDSSYLANLVTSQVTTSFKNLRVMQALNLATSFPSGCSPTLSGTGDTNGNGIAEDQTLTFTAANCTVTQSGATSRFTGSVRVQDLGGVKGYRLTYSNLAQAVTLADTTLTVTANGVFEAAWATAASGRTSMGIVTTILRQEKGGATSVTFTPNVVATFSPTGNGQISAGRGLPAGTFTASGTLATQLTWTGSFRTSGTPASATYNVAISTSLTMTYDGVCTADRAFGAGQLAGVVTGYAPGALTSVFNGCGAGTTTPPGVKR